ncbi:hypothetical protein AKJ41_03580 [candidate division MSBL1 archaeon SCGC-AAA259O05]|uniref:Uncharacterized protein n=1 Tax=candidate division MSBL1 archaeon SCGC-AAA259O05 TaxID=1698271 RepID=A0A133V348_9EURY|nr:hypothetical protein AKJ41_03580 [candidate division MSBL1 archaeon SCGC-AAA259O05]
MKTSGRTVTCFIELESVISRGVLIAMDPNLEDIVRLEEVKLSTPGAIESRNSGTYELVSGLSLSQEDLERIVSQLLSMLLEKSGISAGEIDLLSAYSDAFARFEDPREEKELVQKILESCRTQLSGNPVLLEPEKSTVAANEPKSRMVATGANVILKSREGLNVKPNIFLDLSTCFSGLAYTSNIDHNVEVLISGLGATILDALARGHPDVNSQYNSTLEISDPSGATYEEESSRLASQVADLIRIRRVPSGTKKVGRVPVDVGESYNEKIKLIGCDVGKNGSGLEKITEIGRRASSYGTATIQRVIDLSFARIISKMIRILYEEGIIETDNALCVSGREDFSKSKHKEVLNLLTEMGFEKIAERTVFVKNPACYYGIVRA